MHLLRLVCAVSAGCVAAASSAASPTDIEHACSLVENFAMIVVKRAQAGHDAEQLADYLWQEVYPTFTTILASDEDYYFRVGLTRLLADTIQQVVRSDTLWLEGFEAQRYESCLDRLSTLLDMPVKPSDPS